MASTHSCASGGTSLQIFSVIVLAAGSSTRFPQGNKLIQPYLGKPLISHLLGTIDQLDVGQRIIVTSQWYRDDILPLLAARSSWRECLNLEASSGIGRSIAVGAATLARSHGVFICPGDMPQITPDDFIRTAALFKGPDSICRPMLEGRPGHPVLFGSAHYSRLRGLSGDHGGASVLEDCIPSLVTYASANPGVVRDFDIAEHFAAPPTGTPHFSGSAAFDEPRRSPDILASMPPGDN